MREQFEAWMTSEQGFHDSDFKWDESRNCYAEYGIHIAFKAYQAATASMQAERDQLAAENVALKDAIQTHSESTNFCEVCGKDDPCSTDDVCYALKETPATDRFLAEQRAQAHKEGAHFVANRMLAAWEAGFIDDTAKNAADIARMILTSTEFMADAPEGDFDRSFADGVLEDIAAQLRNEVKV